LHLPRHLSEMALFGIHTGAHQEEICGLRWAWYRAPYSFALPGEHTKSGRSRPLILNSTSRAIVEQRRGIHPEFVFTYKGHRVLRMLNSAWKRARKEADLSEVTVHDLRRPRRHACVMLECPSGLCGISWGTLAAALPGYTLSRP
jgi:integrase